MKDNEVYLALIGGTVGPFWWGIGRWPNEGKPASVDFDYEQVTERQKKHKDVIGFYHTHPHMMNYPSNVDYRAMAGWTVSFGKALVCCIEGSNGLAAHWFRDDETSHRTMKVWKFGRVFMGVIPKDWIDLGDVLSTEMHAPVLED